MFAAICNSGDGPRLSQSKEIVFNPFKCSVPLHTTVWPYRQHLHPFPISLNVPMYKNFVKPRFVFGNHSYECGFFNPMLNQSGNPWYPKRNMYLGQTHSQGSKHSISSYAIGAGDAPLPIARQITFFSGHVSQFSRMEMPKQNEEEILVTMTQTTGAAIALNSSPNKLDSKRTEPCNIDICAVSNVNSHATMSSSEVPGENSKTEKKRLQNSIEKFLQKIMDLYNKLNYRNCMSSNQYKTCINNLLAESRHYFYKLESVALCQVLTENDDWEETSCVADIFHHDYFSMADILSIYLLQLILTFNEFGFISVDPVGSDSLSILSFYRGEFRLGRVLPGVYQMHVTSYQYTACTKMLQVSEECPLLRRTGMKKCHWVSNGDFAADIQHWSVCENCDPFHMDSSKSHDHDDELATGRSGNYISENTDPRLKVEDASNLLKMLCWRVHFVQNPDLEEESYYLCCKPIKPYLQEPEYIFQSDSFKYYFGKMVSPRLNFTNPTLDEITLSCRPYGRFEVLHSFGHHLPMYSMAVGILVDYLRHKRFKRTVF